MHSHFARGGAIVRRAEARQSIVIAHEMTTCNAHRIYARRAREVCSLNECDKPLRELHPSMAIAAARVLKCVMRSLPATLR